MNNFYKIIFFLLLSIFITFSAGADNKIVFFDIDTILSKSNEGKNTLQKLKSNENVKNKEFNLEEVKLKDEENKILASRNIITEEQLKKNINSFQKKLENYKKLKSNEIKKLKKIRNEEILKLLKKINPIIEEYMVKNSISIILDKKNIYMADRKYDITSILIELINEKIK
mgnify:CR=1 FL=1|tara:strand:+ start:900 stop:1412 length:513 start_codon:yes stop_codon:yes gene_type:complete